MIRRPTPPGSTGEGVRRDDIDEIAMARAGFGDHISYDDLTPVAQEQVVRHLSARGASIRDILAQLCVTKRTVSRQRASPGAA